MGIKTVPQPPYSLDLAPCDCCLFLSSRKNLKAVVMRQLRRWKRLWRRSLTRSHKRTSMGPYRSFWNGTTSALQPEVSVIYKALCFDVAQGRMNWAPNETRTHSCRFTSLACQPLHHQRCPCNRGRLLRRGLEFHVCTINKSAHTKKVWKLIACSLYVCKS